mmetsp:Transcript_43630/g.141607  ORF Transcript_43630/g.141607 Transcript_43630/m.141607 type:complete len:583 (-) Transcript_43630:1059-2807(-)
MMRIQQPAQQPRRSVAGGQKPPRGRRQYDWPLLGHCARRPGANLLRHLVGRLARLLQQHLQVALVRLLLRYPRELWPDGHREVADDADGGAAEVVRHMVVAARLGHLVEQAHRPLQVGRELGPLVICAQPLQHARVRLEDPLPQLPQVVDQVRVGHVHRSHAGLLEHRHSHLQVRLEVAPDGERDVAKARQDGRLDVAVERGVLEVAQQQLQDLLAVRQHLDLERAADVANHSDGDGADLVLLVVVEAEAEEGAEVGHVLLELGLDSVCDGADGHERLLLHRRVFGAKDLEEELHEAIGHLAVELAQLLRHHLQRAAQQPLQLVLRLAVVVGDDLHREGLLEPARDDRQQLGNVGLGVLGRVGERRVQRLVRRDAQIPLARVGPLGAGEQRAREVDEEGREHVRRVVARLLAVLRQVVQRGAHVGGDARLVLEPREQHTLRLGGLSRLQRARHLLPLLRGDREDVVLAHAPDGPRRRVLDLDRRVAHQPDHQVERVRHVRLQCLWRRPLQDGAKSKRRRLAPPPIGRGDVALDERRHVLHHLVLDHLRHASEAGRRRHRHVPRVVVVVVLVLLRQALEQQRR